MSVKNVIINKQVNDNNDRNNDNNNKDNNNNNNNTCINNITKNDVIVCIGIGYVIVRRAHVTRCRCG